MSFFANKIKEPKKTQVIAKNLKLDELIKDDILKELKEKFSEEGEIVATLLRFHFIPQKETLPKIDAEKGKIIIKAIDFVSLEHPAPPHIKEGVVVITSNKNKILDKFLK